MADNKEQGETQKYESVGFYRTWWDSLQYCDESTGWAAIYMIMKYAFYGIVPTLDEWKNNTAMLYLFPTIKKQIDNAREHSRSSARGGKRGKGNQYTKARDSQPQSASNDATSGESVDGGVNKDVEAQQQGNAQAADASTSASMGGYKGTGNIQQNYEKLRAQWNEWASQANCTKPIKPCGFEYAGVRDDNRIKVDAILGAFPCEQILHNMYNFFTVRTDEEHYDTSHIDGYEFVGFLCAGWQKFNDDSIGDYYIAR